MSESSCLEHILLTTSGYKATLLRDLSQNDIAYDGYRPWMILWTSLEIMIIN